MTSSLVTLLLLVIGLGAAVALAVAVVGGRAGDARVLLVATVIVALVSLGATVPAKLRDSAFGLNDQRKAYRGMYEQAAREKCLNDRGRPDLVQSLAFARDAIPADARFRLPGSSVGVACVTVNLLPRQPVRIDDFDATRDWEIYDGSAPPEILRAVKRDRALPEAVRRYLTNGGLILVRPEAESAQ